jgi:hypothetical protein
MPHLIRNFLDAWIAWWHTAEPISHFELWGLPILAWGRIGKALEFGGALFFVIDWIGRDRLHDSLDAADKVAAKFGFEELMPSWRQVRAAVKAGVWVLAKESRVRIINLLVICIGFMFDLLAS